MSDGSTVRDRLVEALRLDLVGPRSGPRPVLHAKCVVVDELRAFVTSANFTEAARERNLEAGVLVEDAAFARSVRDPFEALVSSGELRALAGFG